MFELLHEVPAQGGHGSVLVGVQPLEPGLAGMDAEAAGAAAGHRIHKVDQLGEGVTGVDADAVFAEVKTGKARAEIAETWTKRTHEQQVFGVPTFFVGDNAVFIRYMDRATSDGQASIAVIAELVDLIANRRAINEFKHTTIAR